MISTKPQIIDVYSYYFYYDGLTYYVYDGANVILENDMNGDEKMRYSWGVSPCQCRDIATVGKDSGGNYMYPLTDDNASTWLVVDDNELAVSYFKYDAFGKKLAEAGDPFRFQYGE